MSNDEASTFNVDDIEDAFYMFMDNGFQNKAHELKRKYEKLLDLEEDIPRLIEEAARIEKATTSN